MYNQIKNKVHCKWDTTHSVDYANAFNENNIATIQRQLTLALSNITNCNQVHINKLYDHVTDIFIEPAKLTGMYKDIKIHNSKNKIMRRYPNEKWFDYKCEHHRKEYLSMKNSIKRCDTKLMLHRMIL